MLYAIGTAEVGALLLKCVLIVYIWPESGRKLTLKLTRPKVPIINQSINHLAGKRCRWPAQCAERPISNGSLTAFVNRCLALNHYVA